MIPELVAPPRPGPGICSTCRTWSDTDSPTCSNCADVEQALGVPALQLTVATLYSKPSRLRDWLTDYKGSPTGDVPADPSCVPPVRAIAGRMFLEHGPAIAAGPVDGIVVVPSTDRPAPHPYTNVLDGLALDKPVLPWLRRGPGDVAFRRPARDGYLPVGADAGARVVVADDVYTTGARANSAAHALREAKVDVAGLFVLARRVNPGFDRRAEEFWAERSAAQFDWSRSPAIADPSRP